MKEGDKVLCKRELKSPIDSRMYYKKGKVYTIDNIYDVNYIEIIPDNEGVSGMLTMSQFNAYFYERKEMRRLKLKEIGI